MEVQKQVARWVEKKVGRIIRNDLKREIQDENSHFDADAYVDDLFHTHFKDSEIEIFREEISKNYSSSVIASDLSSSNSFDSFEFEPNEFQIFSAEEIIKNLMHSSEEVRLNSLKVLETTPDDLINPNSWNVIRKILQNYLQTKGDRRIQILALKIFQKLITCLSKPQVVCEGFISLTEVISHHLESINSESERNSFEEIYDIKEDKWLHKKTFSAPQITSNESTVKGKNFLYMEIVIKSMWLLTECQKQMPEKWIRFNERRLREIIFSFVYLLSSTTSESKSLSGLELISVLNPTASWCRYWCHTAVGRSLMCSALRKYKHFFVHVVEIVLADMRAKNINKNVKKSISTEPSSNEESTGNDQSLKFLNNNIENIRQNENRNLENINSEKKRSKNVRSAPIGWRKPKNETIYKPLVEMFPPKIIGQAVSCHCMSFVVCLIQFRSGRSLFPIQTSSRKRLLSVQDLVSSMIDYLETFESHAKSNNATLEYRRHVREMVGILKNIKQVNVNSCKRSAEKLPLSQR